MYKCADVGERSISSIIFQSLCTLILSHVGVCVCIQVYVCAKMCGNQETACGSQLSPTVCVFIIKLRLLRLVPSTKVPPYQSSNPHFGACVLNV